MTIADIAEMAGVSTAAVSRYFNKGYLSEEKKEAIRQVIEQTGYQPSMQAQTLRTRKTKLIGVIAPKMASHSIGGVTEGILSSLEQKGYQMLLAVTRNDPKKELEYLATLDKRVDGVIFIATVYTSAHRRAIKKMTVPVVIVGQRLSGYNCVYHDDYHAIYDMTRYVVSQGRKKLGYMSATQKDQAVGAQRLRGYQDALKDLQTQETDQNLLASVMCFVEADFTVESGYEKAKELLEAAPDLDGIVCAIDEMAAGLQRYLREQGIRVPEDILITGHGDSDLSRLSSPAIPTIHFYYEKSGELAVERMFALLEEKEIEQKEIMLEYELKLS